jgi:uncharacterized membrane protein YqjE
MWKNALRLLIILFLRKRVNQVKNDFSTVKENIAVMVESRAAIFKKNFNNDLQRMVNSLFGYMFVLLALAFSGLTGILWLVASAWNSPHRDGILGATMLLLILIGTSVYAYIYYSWKKQPLLSQSIKQIENDWLVFKSGLDSPNNTSKDISDEANQ